MEGIETEYDFNYKTEESNPEIGLAQAFLWDEEREKGIERTYTISEDGKLIVRTYLLFNGKANGVTYSNYRFKALDPETYSLNVLEDDRDGWIESNHEADPETEFETYSNYYKETIETGKPSKYFKQTIRQGKT